MRRVLHQADGVRRRRRGLLRDDDGDRVAEPVRVLGLEPVVLVADPDRDLALHELRVRGRPDDAEDVAGLVELAHVVDAGPHVLHVAAGREVGREHQHLALAGRPRVEVDDRALVVALEQVRPRLRHVLDQLGVDQEGHRERVDREPLAVGMAEDLGELVEVHGPERRHHVLGGRVHRGGGEVVRRVGLRAIARLLERHDGGRGAEVVVGHLHLGIALLEGGELRGPVGPGGAGVERHDEALLAGRLVERLLTRVELRAQAGGLGTRDRGHRQEQQGGDGGSSGHHVRVSPCLWMLVSSTRPPG